MKFHNAAAQVFVPDDLPVAEALARTTHLGIGSHPDDLEVMTWHGIQSCLDREDRWFSGVVVTDGAQSPRTGRFAGYSDDEMRTVRLSEQQRAAEIGGYGALVALGFASATVKQPKAPAVVEDLARTLTAARAEVVYTHSLFDAHDTHVATAVHVIRAIRTLPRDARPRVLYGCEVWTGLDWLPDEDKVRFDVSGHEETVAALMAVYESQIGGGKRYDQAVTGRKRANATFDAAHAVDRATAIELAMDLTPLVESDELDVHGFAIGMVQRFSDACAERLRRFLR